MKRIAMNESTYHENLKSNDAKYERRHRWLNRHFRKQNVGTLDRIFRFLLGIVLIGSVLFTEGTVFEQYNAWVLLPLIGIYPALTAVLGWDPLLDVAHKTSETHIAGDFAGSVKEQVDHAVDAVKHATTSETK